MSGPGQILGQAQQLLKDSEVSVISFHISYGGSDRAQFAVDALSHMLQLKGSDNEAILHMDIAHIPVADIELP